MRKTALRLACMGLLLCAHLSFGTTRAWASGQRELVKSIEALESARGPRRYTAVRDIWSQWGNTNPLYVEEALLAATESPELDAATRAYAGFFAAHARTRRGDPAGARRAIEQLGFIDQWSVVGPFDNEGKGGFHDEHGPEAQFNEAIVEGRAFNGKERAVRWRRAPDVFGFGWLDGSALFRPEQNICYFASAAIWRTSKPLEPISVWAGSSGAFKLFVNGQLVLEDEAYRGHDVDRFGAVLQLPAGKSQLTVKVCGTHAAPALSVRLADRHGTPDPEIESRADFIELANTVTNHGQLKLLDAGLGPIRAFEKLTRAKQAKSADFEAYARFLVASSADDPTVHKARDLAARAAEEAPTIERLLLAGQLAEDYNQQRRWVEQAEAIVAKRATPSLDVVLSRALIERGGLNWRDAFPHYETALELDPDNLVAIRGRVELFNEAGMRRSALALLEESVSRNPDAVNLLNMYASQLRGLGQETEAEAVERRYAQFRFDDHAYITEKLNLALVRSERASAEHWLERLLQTNPDSLWAWGTAARAYRRLDQPQRAIQAYQTALSLAPEDVSTLRALSDLHGQLGSSDEQVRLLRQVLEIQPQAKDVHEYLRNVEPEKPKQDEAYAWQPDRFLKQRGKAANGENQRKLLDLTVTTVFDNGLSSQFRQIVFQPLTDSAAALGRNYYFAYQADSQRVQLRGARVYRADGRIDETVESGVGAANDPSIAMYTSARTYNVQFPRLEAGDVVELRYRIDDVAMRNEFNDYFGDIQFFQDSESVGHAEYVLITPKTRKLHIDKRGIPGLEARVDAKDNQRIYRFWADELAPIHPEPSMPPWSEVLGFVHVSTYQDYQALGKWYWGLSQDQFDLDAATRKLARDITKGLTTEREKVEAVYNWVIKNTRYVALEFGIYGFKPRRCVQTVSRGWGDCKDKATVIVSLLQELGIDSTIVIVRTQMRGMFESDVASLAPFDHAIAYIPSLDLYLDGTAEYTGTNELPAMDQQALGLLVNKGKPELVKLPLLDPKTNLRGRTVKAQLAADGSAELELQYTVTGAQAPSWRRRYHAQATQRDRASSDLGREFPGFALAEGKAGLAAELDDYERPVQITMRGDTPAFGRVEGDRLSLPVTTRVRLTESYASLSQRLLDVAVPVFGTVRDTFHVTLPAGYRVIAKPDDVSRKSRFGEYSVSVEQQGNVVKVTSEISLSVTRVKPAEYQAWRSFCQAVDAAMTPRLVIAK